MKISEPEKSMLTSTLRLSSFIVVTSGGSSLTETENSPICTHPWSVTYLGLGESVAYILKVIFRGCRRQPLYCFQIDVFIWLHVTDIYIYIYIYNTPTYGCASMLTFILNVLGEVLGIGNLYCRPFYSAGSRPCARPRDFENRLRNDV